MLGRNFFFFFSFLGIILIYLKKKVYCFVILTGGVFLNH